MLCLGNRRDRIMAVNEQFPIYKASGHAANPSSSFSGTKKLDASRIRVHTYILTVTVNIENAASRPNWVDESLNINKTKLLRGSTKLP